MNLIIGGDSTIGSALATFWKINGIPHHSSTRKRQTVSGHRPYLDLGSKTWPQLETAQYEAAVFCAAATKLDHCENDPQATAKINVEATVELASFLSRRGTRLLLLSTSQVFDGSKPGWKVTDFVCPVNEYGRQKAEAERFILQMPLSAVLRLTKVVHPEMHLLKEWQESLKNGQPIEAFADMYIAPIQLDDVVMRIDSLIRNQETGIYHFSGKLDISYYSFAKNYFKNIADVEFLIKKSYVRNSNSIQMSPNSFTTLE